MFRKLTLIFVATAALCTTVTTSSFAAAEFGTKGACEDSCTRGACFMVRGGDAWRCYWVVGNPNPLPRAAVRHHPEGRNQSHGTIPREWKRH